MWLLKKKKNGKDFSIDKRTSQSEITTDKEEKKI